MIDRASFRTPIPEIYEAARFLDAAVSAHLLGRHDLADALIRLADMPVIRDYTESLWGSGSPHVQFRTIHDAPPSLARQDRVQTRMPTTAEKTLLHHRDGYHCRFCSMPVIRAETRSRIQRSYPDALPWERKNSEQHAAFQCMWLQYDHILPHARGGGNDLSNVVITCAPCNYARMNYTLAECGLADPLSRQPIQSPWDGLERFQ